METPELSNLEMIRNNSALVVSVLAIIAGVVAIWLQRTDYRRSLVDVMFIVLALFAAAYLIFSVCIYLAKTQPIQ